MNTNTLATAVALPDSELLAHLPMLAAGERTAMADLIAHLAALRLRPSLFAALGYGTLFAYCRRVLRLSEDAASNRIHAAKACLKFPVILDLLGSGELSLSAIRVLRPHLTAENHERVLARARNARRVDIEKLVAELAPRPDVATSVRKLPMPRVIGLATAAPGEQAVARGVEQPELPVLVDASSPAPTVRGDSPRVAGPAIREADIVGSEASAATADTGCPGLDNAARLSAVSCPVVQPLSRRAIVQPLSPERYRVQFTMGQENHDLLRRLQTLMRRELPDGDVGAIFERALRVLHERIEAARFGKAARREKAATVPPSAASAPVAALAYAKRIRPGADGSRSRQIPQAVKRAVWYRDRGQCGFVSTSGVHCGEVEFLELHHIRPYALRGPATVSNLALRCRLHNAYEAEVAFGTGNKIVERKNSIPILSNVVRRT